RPLMQVTRRITLEHKRGESGISREKILQCRGATRTVQIRRRAKELRIERSAVGVGCRGGDAATVEANITSSERKSGRVSMDAREFEAKLKRMFATHIGDVVQTVVKRRWAVEGGTCEAGSQLGEWANLNRRQSAGFGNARINAVGGGGHCAVGVADVLRHAVKAEPHLVHPL